MSLPSQRVLVVTGKGGVGKTTVAAALASHFASRGEPTVLCETAGSEQIPGKFGRTGGGYAITQLAPHLHTMSITPEAAIEDYVVQVVKFKKLYQMVFRNRVMGPFVDAVPGLHDVIQLGKVWDLAQQTDRRGNPRWARIVVDAPATGHGITLLGAPKAMMDLTRAGPMYDGAAKVHEVMGDAQTTGLVLVTLPEDMPTTETIELWHRLGDGRHQVRLSVVNAVQPAPLAHPDDWPAARAHLQALDQPALSEATTLVDTAMSRRGRHLAQVRRLDRAIPLPVRTLSRLPVRRLGPDDYSALGAELAVATEDQP